VNPRTTRRRIEELDALLEGRIAPEDASASSRRLASVATTVLDHDPLPVVELGADRKAALRNQLLADIAALPTPVTERAREALAPRMRRAATQARVAVASTMAATMVGTTGVAVAAQEALPGDALYGIKKATESLRLSLAGDAVAVGRLELRFAEERLEEVVAGSHDQRVASSEALIAALLEMDQRSVVGAEHLIRVAERDDRPELLEEVADFTDRQAAGIAGTYDDLPSDVKPHAEDSLSLLRRIRIELLIPAIERCDCVELASASSPLSADAAEGLPWFRTATLPLPAPDRTDRDVGRTSTDGGTDGTPGPLEDGTTGSLGVSSADRNGSSLSGTLDDVVDGTTDAVREAADGTTSTVDRTVRNTTGTVGNAVDNTTDAADSLLEGDVDGAVDDGTDTLDDLADDVGGTVGGLVDGVEETTKDTLGKLLP
jgi:hypothetical protein